MGGKRGEAWGDLVKVGEDPAPREKSGKALVVGGGAVGGNLKTEF